MKWHSPPCLRSFLRGSNPDNVLSLRAGAPEASWKTSEWTRLFSSDSSSQGSLRTCFGGDAPRRLFLRGSPLFSVHPGANESFLLQSGQFFPELAFPVPDQWSEDQNLLARRNRLHLIGDLLHRLRGDSAVAGITIHLPDAREQPSQIERLFSSSPTYSSIFPRRG